MTTAQFVVEQTDFEIVEAKLTIQGTKPLLVQRNPYRANGSTQPKLNDEELFKQSPYIFPSSNGDKPRYGFPASGVKASAVNAGRFIPSIAMTAIRGLFFVKDQSDGLVEILHPDGDISVPQKDEQMVIKKDGKSIPVIRARFDEWKIDFVVSFSPMFTTIETILNIYNVAGMQIGLGCRRPEKSGQNYYGTYRLV